MWRKVDIGEKFREATTVKKILEIMMEKFAKMTGEKTSEMMRKVSGAGFKLMRI